MTGNHNHSALLVSYFPRKTQIQNSHNVYLFSHYRNRRSQSCPFCRGNLKQVNSKDLWVLTSSGDVIDTVTLFKENLRRFYAYIDKLPVIIPDSLFFVYDYIIWYALTGTMLKIWPPLHGGVWFGEVKGPNQCILVHVSDNRVGEMLQCGVSLRLYIINWYWNSHFLYVYPMFYNMEI